METTPTTKLDAVNMMLRGIGETPVSSLSGSFGEDVTGAKSHLEDTTRAVLSEGWAFNTEVDYPLTPDVNGEVRVPVSALSVEFARSDYWDVMPVVRGTRVYNRADHTYTFTKTLYARLIIGLAFEELPEAARSYIAMKAAREFQDNNIGDTGLHRFKATDEARARALLMSLHSEEQELNMLSDTPNFINYVINTK